MKNIKKQTLSPTEDQTFVFDNNGTNDKSSSRKIHTPSDSALNKYSLSYFAAPEDQYIEQENNIDINNTGRTMSFNSSDTPPEDIYIRLNQFAGTLADKNLSRVENAEPEDRLDTINQILLESKRNIILDDKTRAYLYDDGSVLYRQGNEINDGTISLENKADREFERIGHNVGPDITTYEQQNDPDAIFDESRIRFIKQRRRPETERNEASRLRGRLLRALNNYRDNPFPESEEKKFVDRVMESLYSQADESAMTDNSEIHKFNDGSILQIYNIDKILDTIEKEEAFRRKNYDPQYVEEYEPDLEDVIDLSSIKILRSKRDIKRANEILENTDRLEFGIAQAVSRLKEPERLSIVRVPKDPKIPEREIAPGRIEGYVPPNIREGIDLDELIKRQEYDLEKVDDPETRAQYDYIRDNRKDIIERILERESYDSIAKTYDVDADLIEMFYTGRDKENNPFIGSFRPRDIALAKRRRRDMIDEQNTPQEDQIFSESRNKDSEIKWQKSNNPNYVHGYDDNGYEYSIKPYMGKDKYNVSIAYLDNLIMDSSRQGEVFDTIQEAMSWADRKLYEKTEKDMIAMSKRFEYSSKGIKPSKDNIDLAVAIAYHKYIGSMPEMRNNPYEDTDLTPSMMARDLLEDATDVYDDLNDNTIVTSSDILRTPVSNKDEVIDFIENTSMDLAIEDYLDNKKNESNSCPEDQMFEEDRELREIVNRMRDDKYYREAGSRAFNERRREIVREARDRNIARRDIESETELTTDDIETYLRKNQEFGTSPEDQMFEEDRELREIVNRMRDDKYYREAGSRAFNERRREIVREERERREAESTTDDIETYLRKNQEFGTSPEDQYLMVNVHGAYERDAESRRNIKEAEDMLLFDSNSYTELKNNRLHNSRQKNNINNYFNNKKNNQNNILQNQSQLEKLNSRKTQLNKYTPLSNDKFNGKIPFGSYNKQSNKQENIQLYDDSLTMSNIKQHDKENYIIKNGVMAQARNLSKE